MMGLGYKRTHQQLMHPVHQHAMRRADENLSDLVILGAILTFAVGTLVWIIAEDTPPVILDYYPNRRAYMPFLYGVIVQFLFCLFFYWALVPATVWPRIAMIVVSLLIGIPVGVVGLTNADSIGRAFPFGLLIAYALAVSCLSLFQIVKVASRIRPR
jgi:hypothetical protein